MYIMCFWSDYMGITTQSTGKNAYISNEFNITKKESERLIVLAGNPNVGKSTLFNAMTGLKQHTGNWSGKTVATACGTYKQNGISYILADVPGCYSLKAHSLEEACAADTIRDKNIDAVIVVCDACSFERNLNLVLQICETIDNVVVALNFMDAARKKGITIDINNLQKILGIPIVAIDARKKTGIDTLIEKTKSITKKSVFKIDYGKNIEHASKKLIKVLDKLDTKINTRYLALRLMENDETMWQYIKDITKNDYLLYNKIQNTNHEALNYLYNKGISQDDLKDIIAITIIRTAHNICKSLVKIEHRNKINFFSRIDKFITGKYTGFALMIVMLALVFFITLKGANIPSKLLTSLLFSLEKYILRFLISIHVPDNISKMLVYGGYRVLSWVVAVMLPPMAIFFPLFTILEDVGYLPRVAFNLDKCFKKCKTCGKQALTTCMGFGCNAAGVTGARIIDSPREKLIAILTNSFVPCNGRFPAIITIIAIFFSSFSLFGSFASGIYMSLFVVASIYMSLLASRLLSSTILKGIPSSFALELPPYRKPQFGQILVRSVLDRTVFVLGRAAMVAFPAGIVLYIMCNYTINGIGLIYYISDFLHPLGKLMGLDGVILTAFIFGIPANEIVLPVALMIYSSGSVLTQIDSYAAIQSILVSNGWTGITAICCIVFFLMHWPCSTTLITVKKETSSIKWTLVAFALPTLFGALICILINLISFVL